MNDKLETELRSAIRTQAESVHPADRLGAIRARTQGGSAPARTSWWNRPWALAAGAGLITASVITAAVVLVDPSADEPPVAGDDQREVTVYEVGEVGGRAWLFPEQVATDDTGDTALDAVRALLEHEPTGDARSSSWNPPCGFPNGGVQSVDGGVVTFAEAGGVRTCGLTDVGYQMQRQQLAWTVRTATGWTAPVRAIVGEEPSLPPTMADEAAISPIIIETPTDEATVSSPVTISGASDTFEANVVWEVLQDGRVVEDGFTMGGTMGERASFEFTVDLEPGNYTARAYAEDMETGGLFAEDTVTFTVE